MGVFATRSPDRPNPIELHRAKVRSIGEDRGLKYSGWDQSTALRSSVLEHTGGFERLPPPASAIPGEARPSDPNLPHGAPEHNRP
jgi:hypothetical protein